MVKFLSKHILLALLMLAFAVTAFALRPEKKMSEVTPPNLESMIPEQLGEWQEDKTNVASFVNPEVSEKVEKTYLQSISKTFVNTSGQRIMLVIAYGGDQNDMMQVHKPEICYAAQGFSVHDKRDVQLSTDFGHFVVRRMQADKGFRIEPITYWVTIGNKVAVNPLQWRIERIRYGLTGVVPDGLLFRVSSIGDDVQAQYLLQQQFIQALMRGVSAETRQRLSGFEQEAL